MRFAAKHLASATQLLYDPEASKRCHLCSSASLRNSLGLDLDFGSSEDMFLQQTKSHNPAAMIGFSTTQTAAYCSSLVSQEDWHPICCYSCLVPTNSVVLPAGDRRRRRSCARQLRSSAFRSSTLSHPDGLPPWPPHWPERLPSGPAGP